MYHGQTLDGIPEGNGILKMASGGRYEGEFKAGQYHGEGTLEFPRILEESGKAGGVHIISRFKGSWKRGMMDGEGHLTVGNGDEYRGRFKGDLYHGKGRLVSRNGDIMEGNWRCGFLFSEGNIQLANGTKYEGVLKMGQYCGRGKLTYMGGKGEVDGKFWYGLTHGRQVCVKCVMYGGATWIGSFNHSSGNEICYLGSSQICRWLYLRGKL